MDEDRPLVSIIIPVYNGSDYIAEAIDSAIAQTWPNTEIIVVNDGSTDNTEEIVQAYGDKVRYFSKENGGQSSALNYGIGKMQGAYFSWLSHDDLYLPEKLERELEAAQGRDDVIIYSDWMSVDGAGRPVSEVRITGTDPLKFRYTLLTENPYHGCSMLVPARAFTEHGLFDTSIPMTSDVELWFRMARTIPFRHVPEILVKGRTHAQQVSVKKFRAHRRESDRFYRECAREMNDTEIKDASGSATAAGALGRLAVTLGRKEYILAARYALSRMRMAGGGSLALVLASIRCHWHYYRKHLKNELKYGLLKGGTG